jgi:MoxR-like ATPase
VQAVVLAAKVRAMLDERYHVSFDDLAAAFLPAVRHRMVLNFEGQAEGVTTDDVLNEILAQTPRTVEDGVKTA